MTTTIFRIKVDKDGVMIPDSEGTCEDERLATYDGPGAGEFCKFPFLHDG